MIFRLVLGGACVLALVGCSGSAYRSLTPTGVNADLAAWSSNVDRQVADVRESTSVAELPVVPVASGEVLAFADLYQRGLSGNRQIEVARRQVDVADAEVQNALFRFFPSFTGTVNRSHTDQNILDSDNVVFQQGRAQYGALTAGIEGRMPLVNIENVFNLRKTEAAQRKSYVEYIGSAQTYIRDLMLAYLDLAEANAMISEYEGLETLLSRRASLERARQADGNGNVEISLAFEQELGNARAHLVSDRARRDAILARLYELSGVRVGGVRGTVDLAALSLPSQDLSALVALALRNNPRHQAKQHELDMLDEELGRAYAADFGPTLDAYGTYEYEDRGGSQFGGGATTTQGVVGVQLRVPLFNSGGNGYQSPVARARNAQLASELALVRREIETGVMMAHANFRSARERLSADGRTVNQGDQLVRLVNQRVEAGGGTAEATLETRIDQASFRRQRAQAQYQALREWVTLKYFVGALSEADIAVFRAG